MAVYINYPITFGAASNCFWFDVAAIAGRAAVSSAMCGVDAP